MKPAVLNLTGKTIDKNVTSLLNLGLFKIMLKLFVWKQKSSYEKKIKFADASWQPGTVTQVIIIL